MISPLPRAPRIRLLLAAVTTGAVLVAIFALLLVRFRSELRAEIQRTVIGRDAAVLQPVARHQIANAQSRATETGMLARSDLLTAVLPTAKQEGMLAVAVFDAQGDLVRALPDTLLFAELAASDFVALLAENPISRFHAEFPLDRHFARTTPGSTAPVLEVLLPLGDGAVAGPIGFVQYFVDARTLQRELASVDERLHRQTLVTLSSGAALVVLVLAVAYIGMSRAQRLVAERNERLARANFELTLAAKASALGQITSHLIHGLQGSVAGLRTAVASGSSGSADWESATRYTERLQLQISEVVGLLGDTRVGVSYELSGPELITIILNRGKTLAEPKRLDFSVTGAISQPIDSHTGSLLCLVAENLVQNAVAATAPGGRVNVALAEREGLIELVASDEGPGIPAAVRPRLFEPGVSGRLGGTGLGLAISRLLLRQVSGELELVTTGPLGSVFRATAARRK